MNEVSILLTGDFCPQLRVEDLILKGQMQAVFNDLKAEFDKSDLNIVDLECPLVKDGQTIPKTGPHLKAHPEGVKALQYARVGLVAMANNHIMDYGSQGLFDTMELCKGAGIATVGVGRNLEAARKPFYTEIKGTRIAVLNITENEWSNTHGDEAGANPLDLAKNFHDIRQAKSQSDVVIVIFHGGNEFYELPSPRTKETLRFFVEAGASAVIAHHTHIVSGYEVYEGAPIFYSLGNFVFDWAGQRNSFWNTGYAVRLKIGKHTPVSFEIIPFEQNDAKPGVFRLSGEALSKFNDNLSRLNSVIADDAQLKKQFDDYCRSKKDIYNIYLEPYRNSLLASLRKRGFIPSMFSKEKRRLMLNITRCEAHRDILLKSLEN
ncbi:CapA family protein [Fulvivirgaceae bacterium PWU4]|uniref:CapA family protein n=1 Tax=Chryseosolibacter histidini TaxID=2782349 RepID=A0AAP2GQV4_9BACT|nr:CapA family protein [Chryseosolibacter histidini]MBT1700523.1 CapA family protein [Chryseosolibacter histidini]